MRLLIVGPDKVFSIENYYVKYLREEGLDVIHFPAQSFFNDYYEANLYHKLLFKSGLSRIYRQINAKLKAAIQSSHPDIVWVFKGMEILPETLLWIKTRGIFLVNYNPDNPFLFSGKGSGNKNITRSIGLYNLHFTYNLEVKNMIEERYRLPVEWLPFGYDIPGTLYEECSQLPERQSVCFIGNPDKQRAELIQYLAGKGTRIDVYGNHWDRFIKHSNVTVHGPVYEPGLYKLLRQYRVQLNPLRPHNTNSHGMRTFEVPGIGGIMLAQDTREHRIFFEENTEAFFYTDFADCFEKIGRILSMREQEADALRARARARCISGGYDYKNRSVFVKNVFKKFS